jgi:hypothetical protein
VGSKPEAAAKHVSKSADLRFADFWERVGPFEEKEGRGFSWDPCRVTRCDGKAICRKVYDDRGVLGEFVAHQLVLVDDMEAI